MKPYALVAVLVLTLAYPAFTQVTTGASDRDRIELTRQMILAKRQEIVTNAIDLTPREEESFWPLYRDWRTITAALGDRQVKLLERLMNDNDQFSDQEAKDLLDEWLTIKRDRVGLKAQYVKRFRKILPHKTVARLFQLDNKLDAIISYDLVDRVPLVE